MRKTFILLAILTLTGCVSAKNQELQMRQQFHSDYIALVNLFGEDGLQYLSYKNPEVDEPTLKQEQAIGLLIQRLIVANKIKHVFSPEEWELIVEEGKEVMALASTQARWRQVRERYAKETREFIDGLMKGQKEPLLKPYNENIFDFTPFLK